MLLIIYFDIFRKDLVRRLEENDIIYDIVKYDNLSSYVPKSKITKIIITGSKKRVLRENDFPLLEPFLEKNIKIIGICFGFQYLALKSGGKVIEDNLYKGRRQGLYFNHHDKVISLPKKWTTISVIDGFINIASTNKWIGFQFHPEKDVEHFKHYLLPFITCGRS